jgi:hypothetical protein
MNFDPHLPTIRHLDDAPQRAVLYVLLACAHSAEHALLREHPNIHGVYGDPRRNEPPPVGPPLRIAANLVLGRLAELKESLALYEVALIAALSDDRFEDAPF